MFSTVIEHAITQDHKILVHSDIIKKALTDYYPLISLIDTCTF